ncbi:radical SAM protein, TIGR01212 family [delta proteobacterium NaphS2]|nr:radical SAM protein, TIGR01212 family [delta proteobacterium NaphS2]
MKRYRDFNTYLREQFGERVQRISLDAGLGCPNRDGTVSTGGCIFCDGRGSGTGAFTKERVSISGQIEKAEKFIRKRYHAQKFIAYFQSFSNTYAPAFHLKQLYDEALSHPDMVGLSIGTRPDCVDREILEMISAYRKDYLVWMEYGLQSAHDQTLQTINRGHSAACFERAVHMSHDLGLNVCAHVILGLPGENRSMMLDTARFIAALPVQGVKIHSLYVIRKTPLAERYKNGEFRCLTRDEYVDLVVDFLELLPPDTVIQRLTGDPGKSDLLAPHWAVYKMKNLKCIQDMLEGRETWQGRLHPKSISGA